MSKILLLKTWSDDTDVDNVAFASLNLNASSGAFLSCLKVLWAFAADSSQLLVPTPLRRGLEVSLLVSTSCVPTFYDDPDLDTQYGLWEMVDRVGDDEVLVLPEELLGELDEAEEVELDTARIIATEDGVRYDCALRRSDVRVKTATIPWKTLESI